jgi:hypothetical protein
MSTILATSISWRVQVTFWWDDARFVLDQHVEIDFYSASSLTLQSADRYVTPLDTLFWFRVNQSLLLLLRASCLAERQQMTTDMELLTIWKHLGSPPVLVGSVLLIFLVFCVEFLFSSCVLCTQCCQCLWIVHSWLLLRFSLTFISNWKHLNRSFLIHDLSPGW